jgi:hypothetical protein
LSRGAAGEASEAGFCSGEGTSCPGFAGVSGAGRGADGSGADPSRAQLFSSIRTQTFTLCAFGAARASDE